jgi:hypothetical protein
MNPKKAPPPAFACLLKATPESPADPPVIDTLGEIPVVPTGKKVG